LLENGQKLHAKRVVIATGTFLGAMIHIGKHVVPAGRFGDAAATLLAQTLQRYHFPLSRLKTGTLAIRSIKRMLVSHGNLTTVLHGDIEQEHLHALRAIQYALIICQCKRAMSSRGRSHISQALSTSHDLKYATTTTGSSYATDRLTTSTF
jgi:tRNA U34 5-carboxymethylaminomethyl modifying enzyme MnmG/GidA